ncbi:NADH pyrophosphatase [Aquimixticola soesokkakensis]|uniref:NAD(+) diphosphatase n=1 Tax=Aquimixticola soesokkakensis TaxID=1519096 RepID=A0A1Y5SSQ5_9RHOB|nr:NAD(+) diphosphatase [Aquimixticola soesokkakensis]SLN47652.1 NADH pyrophosphatase [Aquimixticola soesokkakensis]
MRDAEQVTFGGSGLERAAHLRNDGAALAQLAQHPQAGFVLAWRGKILVNIAADSMVHLHFAPATHPLVAATKTPLFLGLSEDERPLFAVELTGFTPPDEAQDSFDDTSLQRHPDLPPTAGFAELRSIMTQLSPREAELAAMTRALFEWHRSHGFCARCGSASQISAAGWQRQCPTCGAAHFPRTDPVVIMLVSDGNSLLLGRSPGWPEGMYSLLAGFIEPGETMEAAVRREVFEEAGIRVGAVSYLASQPWVFPASLMFGCAAQALTREITIDPLELEDARWVTREKAMEIVAGDHPLISPPRKGAIAAFLLERWLADRLD